MNINTATLLKAASDGLTVAELVQRLIDGADTDTRTKAEAVTVQRFSEPTPQNDHGKGTTRVIRRGRKGYVIVLRRGSKLPAVDAETFPESYRAVFATLEKLSRKDRSKPIRASQIADAGPHNGKTVESALYHFRHAHIVKSVDME